MLVEVLEDEDKQDEEIIIRRIVIPKSEIFQMWQKNTSVIKFDMKFGPQLELKTLKSHQPK